MVKTYYRAKDRGILRGAQNDERRPRHPEAKPKDLHTWATTGRFFAALRMTVYLYTALNPSFCFGETVVTTYVTRVQEERRDTRWTLTEWLRIKERMKMMDVWLAMFSDPKKDRFSPELNLIYAKSSGLLNYGDDTQADTVEGQVHATQVKGQLWLTNIFTGSTGARFLNIDFGLEGYLRHSGTEADPEEPFYAKSLANRNQYFSGNFRIFGKNIQDSSLSLKVGQYKSQNQILNSLPDVDHRFSGLLTGAEIQLYIFRFLGVEGNYLDFQKATYNVNEERFSAKGNYYDYAAYVEISLFRLMVGQCYENWQYKSDLGTADTHEKSVYAGLKLQI